MCLNEGSKPGKIVYTSLNEQAKIDASYISEIINDIAKWYSGGIDGDEKYWEMLVAWQKELMYRAGFETIEEIRVWHAENFVAENW